MKARYGHRRMLLRNLASSLFFYEKIETSLAKARQLRPYAEKLITLAKNDSVAARRRAYRQLTHERAVKKLFAQIGPRYKNRRGGYTSIHKAASRPGDRAKMAVISLL